jgi:hypothetical protein
MLITEGGKGGKKKRSIYLGLKYNFLALRSGYNSKFSRNFAIFLKLKVRGEKEKEGRERG